MPASHPSRGADGCVSLIAHRGGALIPRTLTRSLPGRKHDLGLPIRIGNRSSGPDPFDGADRNVGGRCRSDEGRASRSVEIDSFMPSVAPYADGTDDDDDGNRIISNAKSLGDPIHLYGADALGVAPIGEDMLVVHDRLHLPAVEHAGRVNGDGVVVGDGGIAPIRAQASRMGGVSLQKALQDDGGAALVGRGGFRDVRRRRQ